MVTQEEVENYISELLDISIAAGQAIMEIYESDAMGIEAKDDDSPLTKADLASNKIICEGLRRISPNIPIISEENTNLSYLERAGWEYCWIVDPLDGTKEFIKRNGEFTTNVALIRGNDVVAGVIYIPVTDELYYAISGGGAYKMVDGDPELITVNEYDPKSSGLKIVCSRSHLNDETKTYLEKYNNPELVSKGSSLKFLTIACGEADIYPRLAPTMEWDTAAAQIILQEAGGSVTIADSDDVVQYNKENLLNPHFIAKGKEIK